MNRITLSMPKPGSGRISAYAVPIAVFVVAAFFAVITARVSVSWIEEATETAVTEELQVAGLSWARVDAEGLQVFLIGMAPNEADRFKAQSRASTIVDAARVINQIDVVESESLAPPRFSIEILRNDAGISLIGLIPSDTPREDMVEEMIEVVGEDQVSDLMETARHPSPESWQPALDFAMRALKRLDRSKISVEVGAVEITAMVESEDEKARVETELSRARPDDLDVTLDISAPRPVLTPFTLRFVRDAEGARFDACSADSDAARETILRAARAAGVPGQAGCTVGLGAPTTRWAEAAEQMIAAVDELGGGSVTMADANIALLAVEGTDQALFDKVVGELENALPTVFDLSAELPKAPDAEAGPIEFVATRSPEGAVLLRGRVASEIARQTADSYAKAAFGSANVRMSARVVDDLPGDWSVRVLAGIEALAKLETGSVVVTPTEIAMKGKTGDADARAEIARLLVEKLGEEARFEAEITYDEQLDPEAALPTPEECKARIVTVLGERKIRFEPGSATLDAQGRDIMDDIADVLRGCGQIALEVQGYTDSQGGESMNQQLSQQRAEAVLSELRQRRVLTSSFRAVGYGEENPVASNDTEEGREANRRIEFALIPADESDQALATGGETGSEDAQSE